MLFAPCAHVVTVHDLNFLAIGNAMTPLKRAVLGTMVRLTVRSSEEIITPSEFSRREVMTHVGVGPDRVTVTPYAPKEWIQSSKSETNEAVLARFGITRPYIVAFSSLSPHKNIPRLLEAFAALGQDFPHTSC